MNRSFRAIALALTLCLGLVASSAASPPPATPDTPEGTLSFAASLLRSGDSFRAVTEYKRFLHHFPSDPGTNTALEGLGRAYATAGRWPEALEALQTLRERRPGPDTRLLVGAGLYRAGRHREAARVLLAKDDPEPAPTLGTLALLHAGGSGTLPTGAREDLAEAYAALPRKNPTTAGTLAILPGAGHLYVDRPRDAAVSFVLNGAFLWATLEAARQEQWALAGILGAFELGWYTGNIVSAVNGAHQWNRREQGRFFRRWEEGAVPAWNLVLGPSLVGGRVAWRW